MAMPASDGLIFGVIDLVHCDGDRSSAKNKENMDEVGVLLHPAIFRNLGVKPPRQVLMYGPAGTRPTASWSSASCLCCRR